MPAQFFFCYRNWILQVIERKISRTIHYTRLKSKSPANILSVHEVSLVSPLSNFMTFLHEYFRPIHHYIYPQEFIQYKPSRFKHSQDPAGWVYIRRSFRVCARVYVPSRCTYLSVRVSFAGGVSVKYMGKLWKRASESCEELVESLDLFLCNLFACRVHASSHSNPHRYKNPPPPSCHCINLITTRHSVI